MHLRCGSLVIPGISLGFLVGGHGSSQRGTIRMEGLEYKSCPVHSSTLSFPLLEVIDFRLRTKLEDVLRSVLRRLLKSKGLEEEVLLDRSESDSGCYALEAY
ncbi:hypothetical protein Tco_0689384 [Tanacetum coccineum]